jgi:ketosteroid isomerase-like protein
MSQENVDVMRRMLDAFNRGDVAAVTATFEENCELHEPPETPDTPTAGFRGHDGIREWMTNLREVAGVQFEPTSSAASGAVIFSEWIARGVGHGSGVPIEWTSFVVLHVRVGKIVRAQAFLSRDQALEAAGLSE